MVTGWNLVEEVRDEHGLFAPGDTDIDSGARRVSLGDILSRPAASHGS